MWTYALCASSCPPQRNSAHFCGSTVFTKLDLCQAYLQVPLHLASRDSTAFVRHFGVFHYTQMPFGLSSAPKYFQKVMSTVLLGIPSVAVFLKDIVVHAPDMDTHKAQLHQVALALVNHNLTLNGQKCCFLAPATDFIRFHLSARDIFPLQSNIEAIFLLPEPASTGSGSFISWYDCLLPSFPTQLLPHHGTTLPVAQEGVALELNFGLLGVHADSEGPAHNTPHSDPLTFDASGHAHLAQSCHRSRMVWRSPSPLPPGPRRTRNNAARWVSARRLLAFWPWRADTFTSTGAISSFRQTIRP